ncbi:MAG: glycosyltransferase [Alphaproteobacteria bacterium]|nr:glycosyltransferase [Alphaproteobacteria bacterium]
MRVMHVMAGADVGGAENIFLESVLALADAGFTQMVVTRANNAHRLAALAAKGVAVATARFDSFLRLPTDLTLRRAIRRFRPEVIEYWMGRAGTFAPAAQKARSIGWYGGYYKASRFANCRHHVGLTRDLVRHIVAEGVPADHVHLVHTTADFPQVDPTPRAAHATPENAPLLLALARLHPKKGLDTLLEALAGLPDAFLWIAGEGPIRAELEALAETLGVADRVRFLGWRDDRAALLAACDIVAFPSRYEPFGTVMVDAWAARRPLVAAAAAGPAAYVEDGVNGLLVPVDDGQALRRALTRVMTDPALRERLVAGGTATYEASFTTQAFVRDSLALYGRVAAEAGPLAKA